MARIFLSHSSANNAEAVVLRDWLIREGWDDLFLDLDPSRGIAAGERWERALNEAASRCEVVLFLVSKAWLASRWCLKELNLAHRLGKRLFGVLIEDLAVADLPADLTGTWQLVRLASGRDHVALCAVLPESGAEIHVTFSAEGLARLKAGLQKAGLDAKYFAWPPVDDPKRPPYRGLRPLEAEDAGIFFGRDGPIIEALDQLRGLHESAPPRLLVILGASGAGKSSFLRAGLIPRLARDDRHFLVLPVVRPQRAVLSGETGLVVSLEAASSVRDLSCTRAKIRASIEGGAEAVRPLLTALLMAEQRPLVANGHDAANLAPALVLPIDQGEELFLPEGAGEAQTFLALLKELLTMDVPAVAALFTIRSDAYERLQLAKPLEGVRQHTFSLAPMPKGAYAEIIKGPARRLDGTSRALKIEEPLVDALLADVETGTGKDALPLLAFTLERLYLEHGGDGDLRLAEYEQLGRVRGSIEAAVERALNAADADPDVPKERAARLILLRRGLIPWLSSIDLATGEPRRRIARLSEIPVETAPLLRYLIELRLLATDVTKDTGEVTIEPAHEAILRQWGLLQRWLDEDLEDLTTLEGVKRAARDWTSNNRNREWLAHAGGRLDEAERVATREDFARHVEPTERAYLWECRAAEEAARKDREAQLAARERMRRRARWAMIAVLGTVMTFLIVLLRGDYENWEQTRPWARLVSLSTGQSYQLTQDTANVGVETKDLQGIKHQVDLQQHDRVSRIHLSISRGGTVADWRSFYGTTVNGEWLAYGKSHKLDHGDILVLSGVELLVYRPIDWRPWHRYFPPHFPDETPLSGGAILLDGHARLALPMMADAQDQQFVTVHDGKVGLTDHQTEDAMLIARRRVLSDYSPLTPQTMEARKLGSGRVSQVDYHAIVVTPGRKGCPMKKQLSVLTLEPLGFARDRITSWIKEGDRDLRQITLPPNLETVLISESGGPHLSGPHGIGELLFNTGNGWLQVVPTRMAKVEEIGALCSG